MDADAKTTGLSDGAAMFLDAIMAREREAIKRIEHELIEELVAAEREACAKIADDAMEDRFAIHEQGEAEAAQEIAAAIRARK